MRIGIVYLGRKGAGGPISLAFAKHLHTEAEVFAVLSESLESLPQWTSQDFDLLLTPTFSGLGGAICGLLFPSRIRALAGQIAAQKPDVLIYTMSHPWLYKLHTFLNVPAAFIVHDAKPHPGLFDSLLDIFNNWLIRQMDACIILSPQMKQPLIEKHYPAERIYTFELGIFGDYTKNYQPAEAANKAVPTLLFFGRIEKYKGVDILLDAFEQVLQTTEVHLKIVGSGSMVPYNKQIEQLGPHLTIVNRWIPEDEIGSHFSDADIVVLPYTSASQSGIIPIAADLKLPVIATNTGGIVSQIKNYQTGLLVAPGDPQALAETIQMLIADQALQHHLGQQLHQDYTRNKSWDTFAKNVLQLCEQLTENA